MSRSKKKALPVWQESLLLILTAIVMAVVVKALFLQAFYIPSESMQPTLEVDDKILVEKVSLWWGQPHRGDVVVFADPGGWLTDDSDGSSLFYQGLERIGLAPTGNHLVKRVIGTGGDTVSCCTDLGQTQVNGKPLQEPYLFDPAQNDKEFEVEVPEGYLWVEGDNRGNSSDSRFHLGDPGGGFVPTDSVVGEVWVRVWPYKRLGRL